MEVGNKLKGISNALNEVVLANGWHRVISISGMNMAF
jgi:hypothetical protein